MKNDLSFKLVAAIVFAGVIVAFFSPNHAATSVETASTTTPEVVHTTAATE